MSKHYQTVEDLDINLEELKDKRVIGITAGASAPEPPVPTRRGAQGAHRRPPGSRLLCRCHRPAPLESR